MGRVFVLSGASGVGKTTLLRILETQGVLGGDLKLIPRYTNRPRRNTDSEGFEYIFTTYRALLQKAFANDFAYLERWGDYYSGIDRSDIDGTITSDADAIVLASIAGAEKLQSIWKQAIIPTYLWPGEGPTLRDPTCLESDNVHVREIKRRIGKKLSEDGFSEFEQGSLNDDAFLEKRMVDNYLDIAAANGRSRSNQGLIVICDPPDDPDVAAIALMRAREAAPKSRGQSLARSGNTCFVLMPFSEAMAPVYTDHIEPTCKRLGLSVSRADRIFSARPIMDDVLDAVRRAHFIVADMTDGNPNVFYEIGLCHALGKDVILITQSQEAPFDVRHIRRIQYSFTPRGMQDLETRLAYTLEALRA